MEYELAYYDSVVHRFNHDTTRTPPQIKMKRKMYVDIEKCRCRQMHRPMYVDGNKCRQRDRQTKSGTHVNKPRDVDEC